MVVILVSPMLRMNEMVMYFMLENHQSKTLSYQEVSQFFFFFFNKYKLTERKKKIKRKGASKYVGCVDLQMSDYSFLQNNPHDAQRDFLPNFIIQCLENCPFQHAKASCPLLIVYEL